MQFIFLARSGQNLESDLRGMVFWHFPWLSKTKTGILDFQAWNSKYWNSMTFRVFQDPYELWCVFRMYDHVFFLWNSTQDGRSLTCGVQFQYHSCLEQDLTHSWSHARIRNIHDNVTLFSFCLWYWSLAVTTKQFLQYYIILKYVRRMTVQPSLVFDKMKRGFKSAPRRFAYDKNSGKTSGRDPQQFRLLTTIFSLFWALLTTVKYTKILCNFKYLKSE